MLIKGDCVEKMRELDEASVDAIVCDPPYGLEFMGKEWDRLDRNGPASFENLGPRAREARPARGDQGSETSTRYQDKPRWSTMGPMAQRAQQEWHLAWATEALRVLKPGGHLLAFGGTRTYHRLACAVEDAGFEIRDSISWQHMDHVFCQCDNPRSNARDSQPPTEHDLRPVREQPVEQHADESGAMAVEWIAQGWGAWPGCPGCGKPLAPPFFGGPLTFAYGQGFPKSLDVSKAIDKTRDDSSDVEQVRQWLEARRVEAGIGHRAINKEMGLAASGGGPASAWTTNKTTAAVPQWDQWLELKALLGFSDDMDAEVWRLNGRKGQPGENWERREVLGEKAGSIGRGRWREMEGRADEMPENFNVTAPATPEATQWQGWGTALKPSHEPIVVARKPLQGTVAANVLEHGTGALNVDGCRIGTGDNLDGGAYAESGGRQDLPGANRSDAAAGMMAPGKTAGREYEQPSGRWPSNLALSPEAAEELDRQSGELHSQDPATRGNLRDGSFFGGAEHFNTGGYGDTGGASRFFYTAKSSRAERNAGLDSKIDLCQCPRHPADTPPPRDTDAAIEVDEFGSSTTGSGSKSGDQSPRGSRSTTGTVTRPTTESRTSNSSPRLSTSESTPPTTDERATDGSDAALSAASGSSLTPSTSTSTTRAGSSTDDAVPVTSPESLPTSNGANVCPDCGGVISGALRNSHPT